MATLVRRSDHHVEVVSGELALEFRDVLPDSTITEVVAVARHDLDGQIVPEALQEMLHRLAHHRLTIFVSDPQCCPCMVIGVELLRLSKAAQRLGIPPMTLRPWAIDNVGSLTTAFAGRWYGMGSGQVRERLLAETARSVEDRAE